jgi:molybdopterin-binding protein
MYGLNAMAPVRNKMVKGENKRQPAVSGNTEQFDKKTNQDRRCPMKISARNILKGKVKAVKPGTVNTEIVVELPGGAEIVSIITKDSADSLGLATGKEVYAIIKATNVMIGVG